jgi:hypothetical protein
MERVKRYPFLSMENGFLQTNISLDYLRFLDCLLTSGTYADKVSMAIC